MAARLPSVLPSREDLGQAPSLRSGRQVARIDVEAFGGAGRGMAAIGQGLASLGGALAEQQDQEESADVQRRLIEMEQQQARELDERRRTLSGDPSGFADSTRDSFTEAGRGAFAQAREAGLSPRALRRLDHGLFSLRERFQTQASSFELNQRGAFGEQQITTSLADLSRQYEQAQDDTERDRLVREAEDLVRRGRMAYGYSTQTEGRLLASARQMIERGLATRGDPWTALLELEQGDQRARTPSTGQVSDAGIGQLERLLQPPGQARTPAERRAELQSLRTEAGRVSRWMGENLVNEDGTPIPLSQLQHDALAAYAMTRVRRAEGRGSPEDVLQELLPTLRTGNWESVASVIRSGDLSSMEQPASTASPGTPGAAPTDGTQSGEVRIQPVPGGRQPVGVAPRAGDISGIVLHHTAGTTLAGALAQNRVARTGYHYYIDRDGSIYQFTPDNQVIAHIQSPGHGSRRPGAWAHLSSGNTIGISMVAPNDASATPQQREALQRLTAHLATRYGISSRDIVGHGDLQTTREESEGSLAREFREGRIPLTPSTATTTSTASADPNLSTLGDMVMGQAPSSHLSRLSPERRSVVRRDLVHAVRGEATDGINSDIESITRTGRPRTLPDGSTWLDRARRMPIFTPMQLAGFERRVRRAEARFHAIHGMSDKTPEEMEQQVADLDTSHVAPGEDYAATADARDAASRARDSILNLRRTDSGRWASGTYILSPRGAPQYNARGEIVTAPAEDDIRVEPPREAMDAYAILARRHPQLQIQFSEENGTFTATAVPAPGEVSPSQVRPQTLRLTDPRLTPEDRRLIIEARLAAMARVRIPEAERRALSSDEARELLGLPSSTTGMTTDRYARTLREAADKAEQLFGPRYARLAFETALGFRQQNQDQRSTGEFIASQLPGGGRDALTPADLSRLQSLSDLTREEAMWRYGTPSYPLPSVGEGLPFGPLMGIPAPPAPPSGGWFSSAPSAPPVPPSLAPSAGAVGGMPTNMPSVPGVSVAPTGAGPAQFGRPSQEDVAALLESPLRRQEAFDRRFGPGSAAMYLQQAQQGGVSVGRPIRQGR